MIIFKFLRYCLLRFWRLCYSLLEDFKRSEHYLFQKQPLRGFATRIDIFVDEPARVSLGNSVHILKDVEMRFPGSLKKEQICSIQLQDNVFIGKRCVLDTLVNSTIFINQGTSLNHECYIGGDVYIGKNCLLAPRVHITSGTHNFRHNPYHLIQEQDFMMNGALPGFQSSKSVIIEDDCWIGTGVFIAQGTYIGRGSIIGANSVVTHDIPPYSVFAGAPARQIGRRLQFNPPDRLDPLKDEHLPYFYSGCVLDKVSLEQSRQRKVIFAYNEVKLLLKKDENCKNIIIKGEFREGIDPLQTVLISVNGFFVSNKSITGQSFSIEINNINMSNFNGSVPLVLRGFINIKLNFMSSEKIFWGIKECALQ